MPPRSVTMTPASARRLQKQSNGHTVSDSNAHYLDHGTVMARALPWFCHVRHMARPLCCPCHADAMLCARNVIALLWYCNGIAVQYRRLGPMQRLFAMRIDTVCGGVGARYHFGAAIQVISKSAFILYMHVASPSCSSWLLTAYAKLTHKGPAGRPHTQYRYEYI